MRCRYCCQVGEGQTDHQCWERPEDMDTPRTPYQINATFPGSDVAGEAAAALAASSIVFQSINTTYSETMRNHSRQVESNITKTITKQGFCWRREGCSCCTCSRVIDFFDDITSRSHKSVTLGGRNKSWKLSQSCFLFRRSWCPLLMAPQSPCPLVLMKIFPFQSQLFTFANTYHGRYNDSVPVATPYYGSKAYAVRVPFNTFGLIALANQIIFHSDG